MCYPKYKWISWYDEKWWAILPFGGTHEVTVPEYSTKLIWVQLDPGAEETSQVVADISSTEEPYQMGGEGLVRID